MDLILSVEEMRRSARMTQADIAKVLEISQAHYSKVAGDRAKLSGKLEVRMQKWLDEMNAVPIGDSATARIHELATSIRRECMELMHLVGIAIPVDDGQGSKPRSIN